MVHSRLKSKTIILTTVMARSLGLFWPSNGIVVVYKSRKTPFISELSLKPGFHYPSWRPELTARSSWRVTGFQTRQHGPCWRARVSTSRVDGLCWRWCPCPTLRTPMNKSKVVYLSDAEFSSKTSEQRQWLLDQWQSNEHEFSKILSV